MKSLAVRSDDGRTLYAPIETARGTVLLQKFAHGANAAAFSLEEQVAAARKFGMRPLYSIRIVQRREKR